MHVLDSKYPTECTKEWLFLQRGVYDIKTSHDKNICDTKILLIIEDYLKFKLLKQ